MWRGAVHNSSYPRASLANPALRPILFILYWENAFGESSVVLLLGAILNSQSISLGRDALVLDELYTHISTQPHIYIERVIVWGVLLVLSLLSLSVFCIISFIWARGSVLSISFRCVILTSFLFRLLFLFNLALCFAIFRVFFFFFFLQYESEYITVWDQYTSIYRSFIGHIPQFRSQTKGTSIFGEYLQSLSSKFATIKANMWNTLSNFVIEFPSENQNSYKLSI